MRVQVIFPYGRFPVNSAFTGKRNPGSACAEPGRNPALPDEILPLARRYPRWCSDLDSLTLLIIKTAQHNAEHIDDLPDDETADGEELDDTGDYLAGVDAVHTAEAAEKQQAEQEGDETGTGGFFVAVLAAAHSL